MLKRNSQLLCYSIIVDYDSFWKFWYHIWLEHVEDRDQIDQASLLSYLSILDDDPQLPFTLLPSWWKGDTAYKRVKLELENVVNKYAIA